MARVVETFKTHALERERKKVREREMESVRVCERECVVKDCAKGAMK